MQHIPVRRGIAVLALTALAACDAGPTAVLPDRVEQPVDYARQVEAMGFLSDGMQEFGDNVIVEGDILISKAQLREAARLRTSDPAGPRFQYRTTNLVSSSKVAEITVDLSGLASQPGWQAAAVDALAHWSGITDSNVKMVQGSPADITVGTACTSSNVAAFASFPAGGNPGSTVYVNACFGYSISHAQMAHNMVHELGHTIGFRHSNYTQMGESAGVEGAVLISGTPTSGNASGSVMNGGTALNSWAGFATSDLTAVRAIYPLPAPVITSVTNSGGYPLITWNAVAGATSYTVSLITYNTLNGQYQSRSFSTLGTTTGTSFLDSGHAWTGAHTCSTGFYDSRAGGERGNWYEYSVQAHFSNGNSNRDDARYFAPIAREGCGRFIG
jgi:hypothetical protein